MEYPKIFEDEILLNDDDLLRLICEKFDLEIAEHVRTWKEESVITYEEYNEQMTSDLSNYEENLRIYEETASEIEKSINECHKYVSDAGRISRNEICSRLLDVKHKLKIFTI